MSSLVRFPAFVFSSAMCRLSREESGGGIGDLEEFTPVEYHVNCVSDQNNKKQESLTSKVFELYFISKFTSQTQQM